MMKINNLIFGYRKNRPILKEIDLSLAAGHIYGLLGKNGAGKSTLLKNMVGLATPNQGACFFNGMNMSGRPVAALEDLFFIPEELFVPALTPTQFVKNTAAFYPGFNQSDFNHYLKVLDVDADADMDQQSFGQQKKAMIAFGLATNTALLIMDEPTNGLDIPSKIQFRKLMASVQAESRCIIISTHQIRDLDNLIDTLLILHNGSIIVDQSIDDITEKLQFGVYADTVGLPVLYQEETIFGKNAITRRTQPGSGKADIELLFNAVISESLTVTEILNKPKA